MKRLRKFLLGTILTLTALFALTGVSSVQAASGGPLYLGIVSLRNSGYGYQNAGKRVWKIASYESAAGGTANKNGTIYCIKAGPGFGSSDMSTGNNPKISTYTQKFDIRDLSSILSPYINVLPTGTNYNKLLWVLDNLYIMPDSSIDNTTARNEFLKAKIPEERYSLLTDDDIDVIQQLAIWHFTNDGDPAYCYNEIELKINSTANQDDGIENYKTFEDLYGDDGWDRQDAASALFDYFINNAPANYSSTYNTTKPVTLETTNLEMKTIGNNYVAGPYKIKQLLNVDYTLSAEYKDTVNNSVINPTLGVKDASGNIVATNKNLKELVGTEFYLMVPTSSNITGINMTINSSYKTKKATYWAVENSPATEQPVVIVEESPIHFSENVSIVVPKPFDLSLRKFITEINGVEIKSRIPQVDTSALKAGTSTTATYEHPKSPVKVAIGDIVTYTIRVYNEASLDGYVEEITDHLPDQLEYIVDDEVNISYGWQLKNSSDLHTVTTAYLSKANETVSGANKIAGYTGGNTLSYKDVKIRCKVVATSPMASKITNIAEITKFTDGNGNQVTDRDSQGSNVNLPTGTDLENYKDSEINRGEPYIPGQQDDDDFEKLVIKSLDLSLRKFITNVNGTEVTSRIPQVDTSALKAGTSTTATYNHPKSPIKVAIGDTVVYTIRVYNEGEVDGYVEEITDHLPDQLEFISGNSINTQYGWKMYDETGAETTDVTKAKTIKTKYTGKASESSTNANRLAAYNSGNDLDYIDVKVACKVKSTNPMASKITNIAEITDFTDGNGNKVTDRDSQGSNVNLPTGSDLENYKDTEINRQDKYIPGQQDDDDFEKLIIKSLDLSLRKFITNVNGTEITSRIPQVDTTNLSNGTSTTAIYNHTKAPVKIDLGDIVIYTIRVYNEGEVDGYVEEITDHLPLQLEYLPDNAINVQYGWKMYDENGVETTDVTKAKTIKTKYTGKANETSENANKLLSYDGGKTLNYIDVKVACKVRATEPMASKITNIAEITDFTNGNGEREKDRDSERNNANIPTGKDLEDYKDGELSKSYVPGQEDDDDFEKLIIKDFDLSLRKFITEIDGEKITSRIPQVDITHLANGTATTAIYNHSKEPLDIQIGSIVKYTIRVYNEGDVDGYANEIKDNLPAQLKFLPENEINKKYEWVVDTNNSQIITTNYLSKDNETSSRVNKIPAFDGTTLSYKDVEVVCEVVKTEPMVKKITNIAQISDFVNGNGEEVKDRDSEKDNANIPTGKDLEDYKDNEIDNTYVPGQEDDDDFEKLTVKEFDLSLRKFITAVNETKITSRIPEVDTTNLANGTSTTATYNHPKDPVLVSNGNIVTYTIRVYNEGEIDGYAALIKDDIPEGLEFLPNNELNKSYRWVMLDKDGKETDKLEEAVSIATDYLSKDQEKTTGDNLLKAFDGTTLSYKDVEVAFKVIAPNTSDRIIINQAQISKNTDKNGKDIEDRDSTPDKWIEGEDDQDIEKIKVQYFDLSLRKWVTQAIVIDADGTQTVTETGHKAEDDPEDIVKVDIKKKKIDSVTIKFRYSIRVTNEGQIAGYAKEIKDYIPDGLKFVAEDNQTWTALDEKTIVTDSAKDILLKPGESTEVEVILTWENSAENMKVMDNWAEISKDYNEYGSPDIDSTPNNRKEGEDDIDDAPVLVTVQTGQIQLYLGITFIVLVIVLSGVTLIKKFVL